MNGKKQNGMAKRVEGSLTEALGKLTGDKVVEARGAAQKREGEINQTAVPRKRLIKI